MRKISMIVLLLIYCCFLISCNTKENDTQQDVLDEKYHLREFASLNYYDQAVDAGNTSGNLNNEGYMACDDSYIYYYDSTRKENGIYRTDFEHKEKKRLNEDACYYINVYKGHIYYIDISIGYKICRMTVEGEHEEVLYGAQSSCLLVYKDTIYFSNLDKQSHVYAMDLDGENVREISSVWSEYLAIADDQIYFTNGDDEGYIYHMCLDGSNVTRLNEYMAKYLCVYDGWLYYINREFNGELYRIRLNGDYETTFHGIKDYMACYNIIDGCIYYVSLSAEDNHNIKVYDLSTGDSKEVIHDVSMNINFGQDSMVYQDVKKNESITLYKLSD